MIFILSLLFATPARVEYAHLRVDQDSKLMVYALQEAGSESRDFSHKVFVALIAHGREIDRVEVTSSLLTVDDDTFITMAARVNRFKLGESEFFDVVIETGISGSGGISETEDFFFRVDRGKLFLAGLLKGTAGYGKGGWSYVGQTTSELFAGQDGILWIRRERKAKTSKPDDPLIVHCHVSRTVYRLNDGKFEAARDAEVHDGRPLARIQREEFVPCCAGCKLRH